MLLSVVLQKKIQNKATMPVAQRLVVIYLLKNITMRGRSLSYMLQNKFRFLFLILVTVNHFSSEQRKYKCLRVLLYISNSTPLF